MTMSATCTAAECQACPTSRRFDCPLYRFDDAANDNLRAPDTTPSVDLHARLQLVLATARALTSTPLMLPLLLVQDVLPDLLRDGVASLAERFGLGRRVSLDERFG